MYRANAETLKASKCKSSVTQSLIELTDNTSPTFNTSQLQVSLHHSRFLYTLLPNNIHIEVFAIATSPPALKKVKLNKIEQLISDITNLKIEVPPKVDLQAMVDQIKAGPYLFDCSKPATASSSRSPDETLKQQDKHNTEQPSKKKKVRTVGNDYVCVKSGGEVFNVPITVYFGDEWVERIVSVPCSVSPTHCANSRCLLCR